MRPIKQWKFSFSTVLIPVRQKIKTDDDNYHAGADNDDNMNNDKDSDVVRYFKLWIFQGVIVLVGKIIMNSQNHKFWHTVIRNWNQVSGIESA